MAAFFYISTKIIHMKIIPRTIIALALLSAMAFTVPTANEVCVMASIEHQEDNGPKVGEKAPEFSAPDEKGKVQTLKKMRGKKVTVIDFWASWCKPCRYENPNMVALNKEFGSKGLKIVGVSLDKDAEKWKEAIKKDALDWKHVSNLKFWNEPVAGQYSVQSIPATYILDSKGVIVAKNLRGEDLKAKVREMLQK